MKTLLTLKNSATDILFKAGIAITSSRNLQSLREQAHPRVTDLLTRFRIPCKSVLHIGAHYGEEAQEYFEYGMNKAVFVEGDSGPFDQLKQNISKFENFRAVYAFISDKAGTATFYQASNSGASSSLLKPERHSEERPDITFNRGIEIQTQTLDSLNQGNFDLVVIDVQGAELQVLNGGQNTILSAKVIWIEVNSGGMYTDDASTVEIFSYLMKTHSPLYLNLNDNYWGDALFLRTDLLPQSNMREDR